MRDRKGELESRLGVPILVRSGEPAGDLYDDQPVRERQYADVLLESDARRHPHGTRTSSATAPRLRTMAVQRVQGVCRQEEPADDRRPATSIRPTAILRTSTATHSTAAHILAIARQRSIGRLTRRTSRALPTSPPRRPRTGSSATARTWSIDAQCRRRQERHRQVLGRDESRTWSTGKITDPYACCAVSNTCTIQLTSSRVRCDREVAIIRRSAKGR